MKIDPPLETLARASVMDPPPEIDEPAIKSEKSKLGMVLLSSKKFLVWCGVASIVLLCVGWMRPFSSHVIAAEVFATIIGLFIFGSTRYQLDKNALTYGAGIVISATFFPSWWPRSPLRMSLEADGAIAVGRFLSSHLFSLQGLDDLIHADTMLFILGLTFFVAVIAQTRILETVSFAVLQKSKGRLLPTVTFLTATVAVASAIVGGVSTIGLMIRTLIIMLFLSKTKDDDVIFAVIVSTIITTVCGVWLTYGEPPNLIMRANLNPYLTNEFFLTYCLPVAVGTYLIVYWNIRRRLKGRVVDIANLDVLDRHTADVRFLQATRHGEVLTPIECVEDNRDLVGVHLGPILKSLHGGVPLGEALIWENVPEKIRLRLLGHYVSEDLAPALDHHYQSMAGAERKENGSEKKIAVALEKARAKRVRSQCIGAASFIPFVALLIVHSALPAVSLFWASFAAFAAAFVGIADIPKMRMLAWREAKLEYVEYLFLFPLFFSITLLQKSGFFSQLSVFLHEGINSLGTSLIAFIQYMGACLLSAILDNNIVADFASRALHGIDVATLRLFSMVQIAGYAVGGCWTHIGSAQSIVAYAFIRREIDEHYTPIQWIKLMTPIILEITVLMIGLIYGAALLKHFF